MLLNLLLLSLQHLYYMQTVDLYIQYIGNALLSWIKKKSSIPQIWMVLKQKLSGIVLLGLQHFCI